MRISGALKTLRKDLLETLEHPDKKYREDRVAFLRKRHVQNFDKAMEYVKKLAQKSDQSAAPTVQ